MIFKRNIFSKILSNGLKADIALVKEDDNYHAALYIDGRLIMGPTMPVPLSPPKGEVTHWLGNRPSIGLTEEEVTKIIREVEIENDALNYRKSLEA